MVTPEFLIDAVEANLEDPVAPAWFELHVDEDRKQLAMVRHDDFPNLIGWRAPAACHAVAVVASGVAHALPVPADAPPPVVPAGRVLVMVVVDRTGAVASRSITEDGGTLGEGCDQGRLVDALRRSLDLPTPPEPTSSAPFIEDLWLMAIADAAGRATGRLDWDAIVELHPAVASLRRTGQEMGAEELDAAIRVAPCAWNWTFLREMTARGEQLLGMPAEVAEWMDDGMFARAALEARPDSCELLDVVYAGIDEDAAARMVAALDAADDEGCVSPQADGYGTGHA